MTTRNNNFGGHKVLQYVMLKEDVDPQYLHCMICIDAGASASLCRDDAQFPEDDRA
jgi:hypothetical protein